MRWTEALAEQLKTLLGDGLSSSQIGDKLGRTRNSIIGKAHRMKLQLKNVSNARPPRPRRIIMTTKSENVVPPLPVEEAPPCTLFDLKENSCKWPINDGRPEFYFCGKSKVDGLPYCATHATKAYSGIGKRT